VNTAVGGSTANKSSPDYSPRWRGQPSSLRGTNRGRGFPKCRKISELGWQVMCFSAKGEIKGALKGDISRDTINYVELQGMFS